MPSNLKPRQRAIARIHGWPQPVEADVDPANSTLRLEGRDRRVDELRWEPPSAGTIYGVALNFRAALAALGDQLNQPPYKAPPRAPVLYIKPANAVTGWGCPIPLPDDVPEVLVGATLGVVIGRTACRVAPADALAHVAGYVPVNDVTIPHASYFRPAIYNKVRDGFCPIGPWVVDAAGIEDPDALAVRAYVNGVLRHEAMLSDLVRSVPNLLADISAFLTLSPGDIVLVGLPHGLPTARVGDRVAVEIDGVGRLENPVVAESALYAGEAA